MGYLLCFWWCHGSFAMSVSVGKVDTRVTDCQEKMMGQRYPRGHSAAGTSVIACPAVRQPACDFIADIVLN
ncbi:hypothetical protein EHS86_14295 [Erwinia amylovora]|uniref:Uncharacterized protein n=2 Tax=Erwinia amylovora TaxID=552 RepID=A0A831ETK4_ERWAM|nr:hypothetical protein AD997_10115 [Erwinia amylovora]EKV54753.1 hypothetical protein EaACW_2058 [Erwinia amylovora ACW56400]CBA20997.1 hypothetical protein predicted by Glimmer/Critica [Erwinia amylovora CFBP1430]CCO78904.1 hypothetical protein BN432_2108 [Erwinia amylovora Ea356]CCO82702.1 hypothetical protein BN433_2133 [Erwinia amylovora Ea266]CCO90269.1 hypothetical protein BN435_2100 [Erwinia amylovora 01SFR-BO]CCO94032.1 hypothetical protein BN437_2104 [Erwinia amylovora NBRC 12687 = 